MSSFTNKICYWSLNRHHLLQKSVSLEQVLKDVIGVYSSHPSGPLSLNARMRSFCEQEFYNLDEDQLALRIPAMRLSIHMTPKETAHKIFAATVPPASDPVWQKRYSQKNRFISEDDYQNYQKAVLQFANKPLSAAEIKGAIKIPDDKVKLILNRMAYEGSLLRVGAKSLRSNIISYVATKSWAGNNFVQVEQEKALNWLAGEYLRVFGPTRIKDFQWWAGVAASKAEKAISTHETVPIENDYLILKNDLNEFESFKKPIKDSLSILPRWDCYTMGYAPDGRERFVSPDMQHYIYGKMGATGGNGLGVVLLNGVAHGSWESRFKGSQMNVNLNMFEKPSAKLNNDIEEQFNGIAVLLKAKRIVFENK
ncbi:winged helix DNA-binding domain-containing protein [candidate division KSB1 bacterium]|nr:winged helix DNA-binding domain-containing protein [candidate division KSB1 bacterium]